MKLEIARRLFQQFDPDEALGVDDQQLYSARSAAIADRFLRELRFSTGHRFLLVGARGSGKSTELARLYHTMQRRASQGDIRRTTILLDLSRQFWVQRLGAGQVLFLVALAILRAALAASGGQARDWLSGPGETLGHTLERAYLAIVDGAEALDIADLLEQLAIVTPAATDEHPAANRRRSPGSPASGAARDRFILPGRSKILAPGDGGTRALHQALREVLAVARATAGHQPFLVLVDGLDRVAETDLPFVQLDRQPVVQLASRLDTHLASHGPSTLDAGHHLAELFAPGILSAPGFPDIDLVYTAPPCLAGSHGLAALGSLGGPDLGRDFRALRLGLFNIVRRDGGRDQDEIEAMRSLLDRRVNAAGLRSNAVWPGGDLRHPSIDRIIEQSGGLPRDLVQLVRRAVVRSDPAHKRLQVADLEASNRERAREYLLRIDLDIERLLLETWQSQQRPGDPSGKPLVSRLQADNLILSYTNGRAWFLPHPMVMPILRERFPAEFERLAGPSHGRRQDGYG